VWLGGMMVCIAMAVILSDIWYDLVVFDDTG
jgi:hypothetical protein